MAKQKKVSDVASLLADLPSKIRIGPFNIALKTQTINQAYGANEWGHFSSTAQEIVLQDDFPNIQKAVDTLIHEINHSIWYAWSLSDEDKEERVVSALSTGWTQVYLDNPWLLEWIKRAVS